MGFKIVFFLFVEVPSMIAMSIHVRLLGAETMLPVWVYRFIGFFALGLIFFLVMGFLSFSGVIDTCTETVC